MAFFSPLIQVSDRLDSHLRRARSASRSKPSPKAVAGRRKSAEAVDESETGSANFFGPAAKPLVRRKRTRGWGLGKPGGFPSEPRPPSSATRTSDRYWGTGTFT